MLTEMRQIEEFLDEYRRSRVIIESTVRATLNRALEFEHKFNKPFYEFNTDEILEMYKSTHAISDRTLQNTNLTLKHTARWMINKNSLDIKSAYEDINKEQLRDCVDLQKKKSLILTKDDLEEIQSQLLNWVDKCILFLLFEGTGGYLLKELTFMEWEQVSKQNLKIFFKTGKVINITPQDYEMLRKGFFEDELISFGETSRVSKVTGISLYKQRFNCLSDNSDINNANDVNRRYRFIQRRLMLISKDLGINITSGSIQESGLLHYIKEGMKETGLDFLQYIKTENCKMLAKRYDLYTEFYAQIVKEKFCKYFE